MLAAVTDVVIDEPEDVERLDQIVVVVEEFNSSVEPEDRLHAVRVVRNQRMNRSGTLLDIAARPGHPIVFQVAPTAFQRAGENSPAMAVAVQPSAFLYPENVGVHVVPDVERQMANEYILHIRNIR